MIGYITLGTNDLPRASAFYDALFESIGIKRFMEFERGIAWGPGMNAPGFCIMLPFDQKPASVGNGVMIALAMPGEAKVNALYDKAISLGASCEGKPGMRGGGFYAAYFRDLDGNKINAFCMSQ
jgi:catechol 2,3-dioxygenase-like lactoylglutathione lyase family enzyme